MRPNFPNQQQFNSSHSQPAYRADFQQQSSPSLSKPIMQSQYTKPYSAQQNIAVLKQQQQAQAMNRMNLTP